MVEKKGRGRPVRWTAERCIQALEAFLDREGRMPRFSELGSKTGLATPVIFQRAVGCSYSEYRSRYEESMRWTAEKCIAALERFVQKNGRLPKIHIEANSSSGLPCPRTFQKHTGMTMGAYLKDQYPELSTPRSLELPAPEECGRIWTKDRIIEATDRFMEAYGRYPSAKECSVRYSLPTRNTISAHFGIPAGEYWKRRYPLADPGWTADSIFRTFEQFIQTHKRLPLKKELQAGNGLPTAKTVERHTGTKNYSEFCQTYYPEYAPPEKWTRESCIQALEWFLKEYGRRPTQEDREQHKQLPSAITFYRQVGESESQYCAYHHPELKYGWTEPRAIAAVDGFVARNGRPPRTREFCSLNQLPSLPCFQKAVRMSANAFLRERYPEYYAQTRQEQDSGQTVQML